MALADIDKILQAQLPNIDLTLVVFDSDPHLAGMLQSYFFGQEASIKITAEQGSYKFEEAKGTITFKGRGVNGPFADLSIPNVTIKMVNGAPQVSISSDLKNDSTLVDLFPDLKAPILKELYFKDASLYFASYDSDSEHDDTILGFYFQGLLDFDDPPLNLVKLIFPEVQDPTLWGQITMVGTMGEEATQYVPNMVLQLDATKNKVSIGPITLEGPRLKITSNPFFNTSDFQWQTDDKISITAPVAFGDTWFQLGVDLSNTNDNILFDAMLGIPLTGALDKIVHLLGGTQLEVPHFNVPTDKDLYFKDISISYNAKQNKVNLITVDVGMNDGEKWNLWGDVFLENIDIIFQLTPKSGASGFDVDGQIHGIVSDWLSLAAGFSSTGNYIFAGRLADPDKAVTIKTLYKFFTDKENDDLPDLEITTFYIELQRTPDGNGGSAFTFDGNIQIDGEWDLATTPEKISLDGLNFYLNVGNGNVNFRAGGILGIADYYAALEAEYDTEQKWVFTGDLNLAKEKQGVADMNARIDKGYPNRPSKPTSIPPFLADWKVLSLHTEYATLHKNLDFTMAITNTAYPWLEVDFGIHLIHSDASFDKELDGAIKINSQIQNKPIQAEFDLKFIESDSNSNPVVKTFKIDGNYVTEQNAAPSLSDLLLYLAEKNPINSNIPTELNFDAALDGFAIGVQKVGDGKTTVELAGDFELKMGSSAWELYFAYTNDLTFDQNNASPSPTLAAADPASTPYVLGVALGGLIDLSKLPLVGKIPGVDNLKIDKLGFFYTNASFPNESSKLTFKVPAIGNDPQKLAPNPTEAFLTHTGFSLMAVFGNDQDSGNGNTAVKSAGTMPLPLDTGTPQQGQQGFATQQSAPKDPIKWLELNKTLGPVSLEKIGVAYTKAANPNTQLGTIGFYINGSFKIGGFDMALDRLGLSFNIPKPGNAFDPMEDIGFHLGGLFVNYQATDFQISGGFVSLPDDKGVNFIGEFSVIVGTFGLQAYGGFSNDSGHPSLFIFLHLEAPLGGPPFFFINGVAGGFGVNRAFVLPSFDQLTNYPFLPTNNVIPSASSLTGDAASQLKVMSTALTTLAQYVPVREGEYWFALGLDASCFEMIEVSAVLSIAFGVKFQVGLVGSASMTLPVQEPEPIAYIQIDFEVAFSPADGLLAAFGKITPASYVFANFVRLSGGFAFYTWFGGPHEGDFVVTIGGYHPHYQKPDYYPDVPRMQIAFAFGNLNVLGQSYLALTGNAIMAGISLHASWSLGPLSAWFDAGVDFLIAWKPHHYEASAYISVGIALTIDILFIHIRISISVGVMLEIWGPSFGGKAVIDLDIISFTILFGSEEVQAPAVDWLQFSAFLPNLNQTKTVPGRNLLEAANSNANPPLVNVSVTKGLIKSYKPGEHPDGLDWLIDNNDFEIHSQTIAPTTLANFNGSLVPNNSTDYIDPDNLKAKIQEAIDKGHQAPFFAYKAQNNNPEWYELSFGIPPMGLMNIQATHVVNVNVIDDQGNPGDEVKKLVVVLQAGSVQTALWGNKGSETLSLKGKDALISGVLNGFTIIPGFWFPARTAFIPYYYLVFDTNDLFLELDPMPAFNTTPIDDQKSIYNSMRNGTRFNDTKSQRKDLLELIQANGFDHLVLQHDDTLNTAEYTAEPNLAWFS